MHVRTVHKQTVRSSLCTSTFSAAESKGQTAAARPYAASMPFYWQGPDHQEYCWTVSEQPVERRWIMRSQASCVGHAGGKGSQEEGGDGAASG